MIISKKIAVLQSYVTFDHQVRHKENVQKIYMINKAYAKKHGYDYIWDFFHINDFPDKHFPLYKEWFRTIDGHAWKSSMGCWGKVNRMRSHLMEYDYLLMLDATDAFISDFETTIDQFIENINLTNECMVVSRDITCSYESRVNYGINTLNTGVILLKNTDLSHKILDEWYMSMGCPLRITHDQVAFESQVFPRYKEHIKVLSVEETVNLCGTWTSSFIKHAVAYSGGTLSGRQMICETLNTLCQKAYGDNYVPHFPNVAQIIWGCEKHDKKIIDNSIKLRAYCSHLKNRVDREPIMAKAFAALGITPCYYDAVDGATAPCCPPNVNVGNWGCGLTKSRIFRDSYSHGYDCLFLEDDVVFRQDVKQILTHAIHELPENWGAVFLGCTNSPYKCAPLDGTDRDIRRYSAHLDLVPYPNLNHAVIVRHRFLESLANYIGNPHTYDWDEGVFYDDYALARFFINIGVPMFCLHPISAYQWASFSDTENRYVDRSIKFDQGTNNECSCEHDTHTKTLDIDSFGGNVF